MKSWNWITASERNSDVAATVNPSITTGASDAKVTDLSIVLVCWNNKVYLEPCLRSLYGGRLRSTFDVVVTDNGSMDGSLEMLCEEYPQVRVVRNDHNVGLGKASNQGIQATRGRYVLLLNNDTIVNGPSLDAMVDFLDRTPRAGAAGGKLLNPDGSLQACQNNFPSLHEEFFVSTRLGDLIWKGYPSRMLGDRVTETDWLGSACVMLRRAALDEVGLLDDSYFIYGDEADLQYRLKQAGWQTYFLPSVTTIHYGGRSMDRWPRRKMVNRGKLLFFRKHYGPLRTGLLRGLLMALSLAKTTVWLGAWLLPNWRTRASKEIDSNLDVVKLCLNPT
jgi:GT2 family glycosyltransferase